MEGLRSTINFVRGFWVEEFWGFEVFRQGLGLRTRGIGAVGLGAWVLVWGIGFSGLVWDWAILAGV